MCLKPIHLPKDNDKKIKKKEKEHNMVFRAVVNQQ